MSFEEDARRVAIDQALEQVAQRRGAQFGAKIRPIVINNLENGRGDFYLENTPDTTHRDYVVHVVETYQRLSPYLEEIQIERSSETWEPLYELLQKLAYSFLRKRGLYPSQSTLRIAVDCATDAAIALIQAQFPYDTDFEPWAFNFVKYACLKYIAKAAKRYNLENLIYQDEAAQKFGNPGTESNQQGIFIDVFNAYLELTNSRQQVLRFRYECGLSSKEIAMRMKKSVSAVDKLHFDAIRQLRQSLDVEVT